MYRRRRLPVKGHFDLLRRKTFFTLKRILYDRKSITVALASIAGALIIMIPAAYLLRFKNK